jgi:hypothetical protein
MGQQRETTPPKCECEYRSHGVGGCRWKGSHTIDTHYDNYRMCMRCEQEHPLPKEEEKP